MFFTRTCKVILGLEVYGVQSKKYETTIVTTTNLRKLCLILFAWKSALNIGSYLNDAMLGLLLQLSAFVDIIFEDFSII